MATKLSSPATGILILLSLTLIIALYLAVEHTRSNKSSQLRVMIAKYNSLRRALDDDFEIGKSVLKKPIRIAFLIPTKSMPDWTIDSVPLLTTFLASVLPTITAEERQTFVYTIYLGFDQGDPLFDDIERLHELHRIVKEKSGFAMQTYRFSNTHGRPVSVWNRLFKAAFREDNHYFYQANDDLTFQSPGWTTHFVNMLRYNALFPNIGVVAPKDIAVPTIMTQSFVSRIHMHIFGSLYPPAFKNWYSDNWMTSAYANMQSAFCLGQFTIVNNNTQGTRYDVADDEVLLEPLVRNADENIVEFLQTHIPGPTMHSDPIYKSASLQYSTKADPMVFASDQQAEQVEL